MTVFPLSTRAERSAWVEIDLAALRQNVAALKKRLPEKCRLMTVVKANAYGHGALPVARGALAAGAACLGVATLWEGSLLRVGGIEAPVIILSPTSPEQAPLIVENHLTPTITSWAMAEALSRAGGAMVHVKVDTGMNRSGLEAEDAPDFLARLRSLPALQVEGVFSHLANADEKDRSSAYDQFRRFIGCLRALETAGLRPPLAHIANSAAMLDMPEMSLDLARAGLVTYGLYPSPYVSRVSALRPVLSWKAVVMETRRLEPGEYVSYGGTFTADRPTTVALLTVGYADGFRRALSNRGEVLLHGRRCRIAGRVCMDLTVIDCGDLPVQAGDEAVLIGRQGEAEIAADEMAGWLDTINYEVTTQITDRVPRFVVNE